MPSKPSNKLSNQSYFTMRLKDSGYVVWRLYDQFSLSDCRKWVNVVDPGDGGKSIFITCFKQQENGMFKFELTDENGGKSTVITASMGVIVSHLRKIGARCSLSIE